MADSSIKRDEERSHDRHKRHRSRSRSPRRDRKDRHHRDERRSRRSSRSRSHSRSATPDEDEDDRRERKRRERERDREEREEREERKRRKREKRERREKEKKQGAGDVAWGKYGLISMGDYYSKDSEFRAWLVEVKMLNPETLSHARQRELFSGFVEDYNTGTMPSEKYYALEPYEQRMRAIRMGETLPDEVKYDPRKDEEAHKQSQRKLIPDRGATLLTREQLLDLQRIERERTEVTRMKRMGLKPKETMGVRYQDPQAEQGWGGHAAFS